MIREIPLLLLLGLAGAAGAIARHVITVWANPITDHIPCGTLLVNVIGCFLLGMIACASGMEHCTVSPKVRMILGTGFLGSFTTFATFSVETFEHLQHGRFLNANVNIGLNLVIGLIAVWIGYAVVNWYFPATSTLP